MNENINKNVDRTEHHDGTKCIENMHLYKMDNNTKKESDSDNMSEQERWRLGL